MDSLSRIRTEVC